MEKSLPRQALDFCAAVLALFAVLAVLVLGLAWLYKLVFLIVE